MVRRMRLGRFARATSIAAVLSSLLLFARTASADPRTDVLVKKLKESDDWRVKMQAALALGASGDPAAVQPLCGALKESRGEVRTASAAALGKLKKKEGSACLKSAKGGERDASVKAQIDQSIADIDGGGDTPPAIGANTKYYVAIQITNKTGRSDADLDKVVRSAATAKLLAASGYAIAPKSETPKQGGDLVKAKKVKGLLLIEAIDAPSYSGGKVSVSVSSTIWTYPDKSLKATIPGKYTVDAAGNPDLEGENMLIQTASEKATEKLIAAADKF